MLPGGNEIILTGGNSHLVLYVWKNKQLVEFYNEPLRNVIELVVCKNWFALKYKKHHAKLYEVAKDGEIKIEQSWMLKIKTYKGLYRTMLMTHFREDQLMIIDVSHVAGGDLFEIELFDMKEKKTISNTRQESEVRNTINNLVYSHKYAILFTVQANGHGKAYKIIPDEKEAGKLKITFFKKRILSYKDRPTYFIANKSGTHFIATTNEGSVFIGEANTLDFELKLTGFGFFNDICMYQQNNNVYMYTTDFKTKAFGKVSIEQALGYMLMEEDFLNKKAIKEGEEIHIYINSR